MQAIHTIRTLTHAPVRRRVYSIEVVAWRYSTDLQTTALEVEFPLYSVIQIIVIVIICLPMWLPSILPIITWDMRPSYYYYYYYPGFVPRNIMVILNRPIRLCHWKDVITSASWQHITIGWACLRVRKWWAESIVDSMSTTITKS